MESNLAFNQPVILERFQTLKLKFWSWRYISELLFAYDRYTRLDQEVHTLTRYQLHFDLKSSVYFSIYIFNIQH